MRRNDNAPQFRELMYRFEVEENQKASVLVGRVEAVDADLGDNARVSYRLTDEQHFFINEHGEISTGSIALDREQVDTFPLVVVAYDHGSPSQTSSTTVLVKVLDKYVTSMCFFFILRSFVFFLFRFATLLIF